MHGLLFASGLLGDSDRLGLLNLDTTCTTVLLEHLLNLLLNPLDLFFGLSLLVGFEPGLFGRQVVDYSGDVIPVGRRRDSESEQRVESGEGKRDVGAGRRGGGGGRRRCGGCSSGGASGSSLLASLSSLLLASVTGESAPSLEVVSVLFQDIAFGLIAGDLTEVERFDLVREIDSLARRSNARQETIAYPVNSTLDSAQKTSLILASLGAVGTLTRSVCSPKPSNQDSTILDLSVESGLLGLFSHSLDGRGLTGGIFSSTLGLELVVLGFTLGVDGGSVARRRAPRTRR